jgi:hypothetical protein
MPAKGTQVGSPLRIAKCYLRMMDSKVSPLPSLRVLGAASLLLRVRKWSAGRAWRLRIAKWSSMLCAIVAVARKLASILHRMWVSETDFHVGLGAKVTQRLRLKPAQ